MEKNPSVERSSATRMPQYPSPTEIIRSASHQNIANPTDLYLENRYPTQYNPPDHRSLLPPTQTVRYVPETTDYHRYHSPIQAHYYAGVGPQQRTYAGASTVDYPGLPVNYADEYEAETYRFGGYNAGFPQQYQSRPALRPQPRSYWDKQNVQHALKMYKMGLLDYDTLDKWWLEPTRYNRKVYTFNHSQ